MKKSIPDISGSVIGFLPYFDLTLVIAGIFENHIKKTDFLRICLQFMLLRYCTRACAAGILTVEMELLL